MQAIPDARQQSFDELYGPPENFLEIEVGTRNIFQILYSLLLLLLLLLLFIASLSSTS